MCKNIEKLKKNVVMAKSTMTYWNALDKSNENKWEVIEGSNGQLEQLASCQ